jgi:hypothetical protein
MSLKKLEKWKIDEGNRIESLSNRQLFDETLELAHGDDYDGCFTTRGSIVFDMLRTELECRLSKWLKG